MAAELTWIRLSAIKPEKQAEAMQRLKKYPGAYEIATDPIVEQAKEMFNAELIIGLPTEKIRSVFKSEGRGTENNSRIHAAESK